MDLKIYRKSSLAYGFLFFVISILGITIGKERTSYNFSLLFVQRLYVLFSLFHHHEIFLVAQSVYVVCLCSDAWKHRRHCTVSNRDIRFSCKNCKKGFRKNFTRHCSARDWDGKDYLRIIPRVVW